jgi:hypothetical protein
MPKILILLGLGLLSLGLILNYIPNSLHWFGRLPGDIRIEEANRSIFIPITSMIIISIVISFLFNLFLRK